LFILAFLVVTLTQISPIIIILVSATTGIVVTYRKAVNR
jgi:hypothetical protein